MFWFLSIAIMLQMSFVYEIVVWILHENLVRSKQRKEKKKSDQQQHSDSVESE